MTGRIVPIWYGKAEETARVIVTCWELASATGQSRRSFAYFALRPTAAGLLASPPLESAGKGACNSIGGAAHRAMDNGLR